jgi:hypothetical protein
VDELGEDILSGLGGAEPVLGRRRLQQICTARLRRVRREQRAEDRQQDEEDHDDEPGTDLARRRYEA